MIVQWTVPGDGRVTYVTLWTRKYFSVLPRWYISVSEGYSVSVALRFLVNEEYFVSVRVNICEGEGNVCFEMVERT